MPLKGFRRKRPPAEFLVQPLRIWREQREPCDAHCRRLPDGVPHECARHPAPARGGCDVHAGEPRRKFVVRAHIMPDQRRRTERCIAIQSDVRRGDVSGVRLIAEARDPCGERVGRIEMAPFVPLPARNGANEIGVIGKVLDAHQIAPLAAATPPRTCPTRLP